MKADRASVLAIRVPSIQYRRVVDLSQEIAGDLQVFPGYPPPIFVPWTTREAQGYLAEALFLVSHSGTHVDAPWHYRPEGRPIHEFPPSRFMGTCHLIDVRPRGAKSRIAAVDLRKATRRLRVRRGDAVILRTGWETKRGTPAYLGKNPGLSRDGARELVRWGVSIVGIDTANIDVAGAADFPAHHELLRAETFILENVANLASVRASTFVLIALPLRLRGATGSPVRAIGLV